MPKPKRVKTTSRATSPMTVPQILAKHILASGLTNRDIARACGFGRPNMVSMLKRGHTRLPLDRLASIARILDIDVLELFDVWMAEYYGRTWEDLRPIVMGPRR